MPHDMVIFPNRIFGEMAGGLETVAGQWFEQICVPKNENPKFLKVCVFRFWELFLGKWQDVPTREVMQV